MSYAEALIDLLNDPVLRRYNELNQQYDSFNSRRKERYSYLGNGKLD